MTEYSADTFMTPVIITTGVNDEFDVTEDPTGTPNVMVVTLDAGTYYLHDDESRHSFQKGLYFAIRKLLNDGTTAGVGTLTGGPALNTYTWSAVDPASSTGLTDNGLQFEALAFTDDFRIVWTSSSVDGRLFGESAASPADRDSVLSGSDHIATFPRATKHRMATRNLGDGEATIKIREDFKLTRSSSRKRGTATVITWEDAFFRDFFYEDVRAVEIEQSRANEAEWAATTGRATADRHAVWYDVWQALTDGLDILVVHNSTSDLQIDTHSFELIRLATNDLPWKAFAVPVSPAGDFRNIVFSAWVDPSVANYDH